MTRDFTATTFVVHNRRILLHRHLKLGLILPPGGHVAPHELPDEAAVREVHEESGVHVRLISMEDSPALKDVRVLCRPLAVLLEDIEAGHQHIDLIYVGIAEDDTIEPESGNHDDYMWVSENQLETVGAPDNVVYYAREAVAAVDTLRSAGT